MPPDDSARFHDRAETGHVSHPADLLRVVAMTQAMLDETDKITLDEAGRHRLSEIHRRALQLVKGAVSPDLEGELNELGLPFDDDGVPTEPELRVAQSQLIGWLNGLLMGLQAAAMREGQAQPLRRGVAETPADADHGEDHTSRAYL